jgi:hypothetical protein
MPRSSRRSPRLAGLAIALEMARDGDDSALEQALAAIPVTAAETKALLTATPRFDEARAKAKKIEIVGEHAQFAHDLLGRVMSSFSAMMGASARGNQAAEEQAAKFEAGVAAVKGGDLSHIHELTDLAMSFGNRPRRFDTTDPLARLGGKIVSVRVEGAAIIAVDDHGTATRIHLDRKKPPEVVPAKAPPVPPLEGMRDPGGEIRAWVPLADDTVLAVGGDEDACGWIAVGSARTVRGPSSTTTKSRCSAWPPTRAGTSLDAATERPSCSTRISRSRGAPTSRRATP